MAVLAPAGLFFTSTYLPVRGGAWVSGGGICREGPGKETLTGAVQL